MVNDYGFERYSIREIKEITGKELVLGTSPNKFNLLYYKYGKGFNISYFDSKRNEIVDLMHIPNNGGAMTRSVMKKLTREIVVTNTWEYLKNINRLFDVEGGFGISCVFDDGEEEFLTYDGTKVTIL